LADVSEQLECVGECGIDQDGLSKLKKLKILNCSNNTKIKSINHMADTLASLLG